MEKERRKFKRFDAYMSVRYELPNTDGSRGIALSKDLSREGLKINSPTQIPEGSTLDLELDIPDDPKPVRTTGKVVWSQTLRGQDQGYDLGVRFMMMDPVDKFRVLDYAYNHWLETKVNDFTDPEQVSELE
ncbi:MAG: PilZ domain-containing protein [Candidatus Omnitrophica bacterium]|nr:PilZ domain-containing protein [Candidatus Omnitrophota bacterium]